MKKYIVEQFIVIDKQVPSDQEFQKYVMDKKTLAEYKRFVYNFDVQKTSQLMLNNRAMFTKWIFDNKQQAEEFVAKKESVWRDRVTSQEQIIYSYGPLQIEEAEHANPKFI